MFLSSLHRRLTSPPATLSGEALHAFSAIGSAILMGMLCHALFLGLFVAAGELGLAAFNFGSVLLFAALFFVAMPRGRLTLMVIVASLEVVLHAFVATATVGWESGFHYYVLVLGPMWLMVPTLSMRQRALVALHPSAAYILLYVLFREPVDSGLPESTLFSFHLMNMASVSVVLAALCFYFAWAVARARAALSRELDRSERLLLNVLPSSIAERLKVEPGPIADGFEACTVLFADIVGFTPLSERMRPDELVSMLNRIFSAFDGLSERHGLEKIKTIGDAYMVAAGIPEPVADHAERMARMALEMLSTVAQLRAETGLEVGLRIGIHSGPAVAGVIGKSKFIYDLWGDTVNTASRMESHGVPGQVHVTATTAALLRPGFRLESRGVRSIKGKGDMETFLLLGRDGEAEGATAAG